MPRKTRKKAATLAADGPTIARAIRELHIDVPVYGAEVVRGRLKLRLFGGKVAYWTPTDETRNPVSSEKPGFSPEDPAPQEVTT